MAESTSILNGLSSLSAYAIANPTADAIAALVTLGIVGAASLVVIVHEKWEAYEEKKHKNKMLAVNVLRKKFLPDFPELFQFSADGKTADAMHLDDSEIEDIGRFLPEVPVPLIRYQQYVADALFALREFYNDTDDDVTRKTLTYLMVYLEKRCLSFAGYDKDIRYLHEISQFVINYASQGGTKNSVHFDHLKKVYTCLEYAAQDLEKHKESMSLLNHVEETLFACRDASNQLIRLQVKMIVPKKHQKMVDIVTLTNLANDILREEYIDYEIWGIPLAKLKEIGLPESIFHKWIAGTAKYALQAQNPRAIFKGEEIFRPEELYSFINWARPVLAQDRLAKKDKSAIKLAKEDRTKLHDGLELIHQVFRQAPNPFTTKLGGTDKKPEFVTISDNEELLDAAEIMADYMHLTHGVISLQALCTELSINMTEVGLDFFNDHDHFNKVFAAFKSLYIMVQEDLRKVQKKMLGIRTQGKNTARLADELKLQDDVDAILKNIQATVLDAADKVCNYKNKHPKTVEESINDALSASEFFEKLYDIKPAPILTAKIKGPQVPAQEPVKLTPAEILSVKVAALNKISNQLLVTLSKIQHGRIQDPQIETYQKIYNALRELQLKSISLLKEENSLPDRAHKAQKLYQLTFSLFEDTMQFLSRIPEDRAKKAQKFVENIHKKLDDIKNQAIIDRHHNSLPKFIYENFGFFKTATREKISILEKACDSLKFEPSVSVAL